MITHFVTVTVISRFNFAVKAPAPKIPAPKAPEGREKFVLIPSRLRPHTVELTSPTLKLIDAILTGESLATKTVNGTYLFFVPNRDKAKSSVNPIASAIIGREVYGPALECTEATARKILGTL